MSAPVPSPVTLVGRDHELVALRARLAATVEGHGSLVLVSGEAGIGKTTLAESLCQEARDTGALVLIGRCYDLAETPPYGPWLELFATYHPTGDLLPPAPLRDPDALATVTSQAILFRQTRDFLAALAVARPVVLLLDDLQWADPASLELLRFLGRAVASLPFLLLATLREDELTRRDPLFHLLPALVRESAAARVPLQRIALSDLRQLIDARYALREPDATRLTTYLQVRSDGNPFFLGELLHTLESERVLHETAEGWHLGDLTAIRVPMLLRQVIEGRLARLDEETRRLLAAAAVIGQEVPLDLWAAVAEVEDEDLLVAVEQGAEARLLVEVANDDRIQFVHALLREALYEGIAGVRRRRIHRRVAETLAAVRGPDPDAVALHYQRARDARAVGWLIRAGERAQAAYARQTAVERFEAALALLPETDLHTRAWLLYRAARLMGGEARHLDAIAEALRLAAILGDEALAAAARFGHGLVRLRVGEAGFDELVAGAEAIEALAPEDRARVRAVGATTAEREAPRSTVLLHSGGSGRYATALALGEGWLIPAANASPADVTAPRWADGWAGLGYTCIGLGRPAEVRALFDRAAAGYEREGQYGLLLVLKLYTLLHLVLPYAADDLRERDRALAAAVAAGERARIHFDLGALDWLATGLRLVEGRWDDAAFAQAVRLLRAPPGPPERQQGLYVAWWYRERGERQQAWELVDAALPAGVMTPPGSGSFLLAVAMQRVAISLALDEGNLPLARTWLDAHDTWFTWSGAILGQSERQRLWAEYHRAAGDYAAAQQCAQQALAHATEPRQPLALLAAHRLIGELATDAARFDGAAAHLEAALTLADACAAAYERALTLLALAELRTAMGETNVARTLRDEAVAICTPLGAQPTLTRANALAARLADRERPTAYPAGLSGREVDVLRLMAAGRTNREIAADLFLSPATVRHHVEHILTKTESENRAAAAAFAQRHDLA
jgi:DNA-binding CsgD family transcriptional regulator